MPDSNPLLQRWTLPPWSSVRAEHLLPAITAIVTNNQQIIEHVIASQTEQPNWDDLILAVDEADATLAEAMAVIEYLSMGKSADSAWEKASAQCSQIAGQYRTDKLASVPLFRTFQRLENSAVAVHFDAARKASLAKILRGFRLSGVELPAAQQEKLARLDRVIGLLEQLFASQIELANAAWTKHITDAARLDGVSAHSQAQLALKARQAGLDGWLLTLDQNTCQQIMTYARDRALREEYFIAWTTRASDQGPQANQFDNEPVLSLLLALRHEKAEILGFDNYAQLRLDDRMVTSTAQVSAFLQRQVAQAKPLMEQESKTLQAFADQQGFGTIQAWDQEFLAERLRVQQLDGALQGLRQYFPLDATVQRLCRLSEHLFGIVIREQSDFDRWHEHVRLYEVSEHGQVIGHIYIDPYASEHAADYAWTGTVRNRRIDAEGRASTPIAVLSSNFTAPTPEHPCLLSHHDLRVLFHEFGHCLQHVLTRSPHHNLSGISQFPRDTAEFAGQLFEQWCLSREFILWLAAHHQTGERLSEARANTALTALSAQSSRATGMLLMGALFDFELHHRHGDGRSIAQVFDGVQRQFAELQMPDYCRFANSFDYLVTGYEASVYAYKWSGVLATEAFKRFEHDGVFNPQTGRAFREAFFSGDSPTLLSALEKFLGRPVSAELFEPAPDQTTVTSD
jgi:oligopeptidase A